MAAIVRAKPAAGETIALLHMTDMLWPESEPVPREDNCVRARPAAAQDHGEPIGPSPLRRPPMRPASSRPKARTDLAPD
jgi:hypothetical protein